MDINWIINQIIQNIPTILISIGISISGSWGLREFVDWLKQRNLQTQQADMQKSLQSKKAEIDRELEISKVQCQQDIQTHYLHMQLKTTTFYKAYPELHWAFKETEGAVYQLFYHSYRSHDETHKIWCTLTKKLAEHSIFLDDTLRDACVIAKDILMSGIELYSSIDEKNKKNLMNSISEKVDIVSNLMRAHLLEERVKIKTI